MHTIKTVTEVLYHMCVCDICVYLEVTQVPRPSEIYSITINSYIFPVWLGTVIFWIKCIFLSISSLYVCTHVNQVIFLYVCKVFMYIFAQLPRLIRFKCNFRTVRNLERWPKFWLLNFFSPPYHTTYSPSLEI